MFSSSHFAGEYFGEHFKSIDGNVYIAPGKKKTGGRPWSWVDVNQENLKSFNLDQDDQDALEFVVAFVLSQ